MRQKKEAHHRLSRYFGGKDTKENISYVSKMHHKSYHILFPGDMTLEKQVAYLNSTWIQPDKMLVIVERPKVNPNQLKLY